MMFRKFLTVLSLASVSACGVQSTTSRSQLESTPSPSLKGYYVIDLTKESNWKLNINLMDESVEGPFHGAAVIVPGPSSAVTAKITAGPSDATCKIMAKSDSPRGTVIKMKIAVDVDDNDSYCDLMISTGNKNGEVHFYEIGT